jgi:hypothetical protein
MPAVATRAAAENILAAAAAGRAFTFVQSNPPGDTLIAPPDQQIPRGLQIELEIGLELELTQT